MNRSDAPSSFRATGRLWVLGGVLLILLPVVALLTFQDIHRQKVQSQRLLLEKGAALIRSFEAATRFGMAGMEPGMFRLQRLLMETARLDDIVYLLVADDQGRVVAHNDPARLAERHGLDLDLKRVVTLREERWRVVEGEAGRPVFEVYRQFLPGGERIAGKGPSFSQEPGREKMHRPGAHRRRPMMRRWLERNWLQGPPPSPDRLAIFVGLDMRAVEAARAADTRRAVATAAVVFFAGAGGILLLVLLQGYRSARRSLRRMRVFSDRLVADLPLGLVAIDPAGGIAAVNPVGLDRMGRRPERVIGVPAETVLPPELRDLAGRLGPAAVRIEAEVECALRPGAPIPLSVSAALMTGADGREQGRLLLFKDLSEVRALEAALARSQRLAAIGSLAGGVAHEIRNPLSSLKGFATYFQERSPEGSQDLEIARIMIQEVDRLDRVVGQLLDLSRPVTVSRQALPVDALLEGAAAVVRPRAAAAGVRLTVSVPDDLPPVPMDPERMHQVLLNLLLNSLEAMAGGGTLALSATEQAVAVAITVADTGPGIAPGDFDRVFDPYFTTKSGGTGLGLAIVHNIVEAHRGTVTIDSRPGEGTRVRLQLPLADGEAPHGR